MAIRVEKRSIRLTPTSDPNIMQVDADVTRDGPEKQKPKIEHVSVLWNVTTPKDGIKETIREALKKKNKDTLEDEVKDIIGETIISETTGSGQEQPVIIQAETVTIEAKSIIINEVK